jgi:hypothetical protein
MTFPAESAGMRYSTVNKKGSNMLNLLCDPDWTQTNDLPG